MTVPADAALLRAISRGAMPPPGGGAALHGPAAAGRRPASDLRRPVVLDLSRLVGRVRHPTPSGIDRVEHAYARHFLGQDRRAVAFVMQAGAAGARVLPARSLERFLAALERGWADAQGATARDWLRLMTASRRAAGSRRGAAPAPTTIIPSHQNWHRRRWLAARRGRAGRLVLFLHDTIPADYPEYARPGGALRHQQRLDNALAVADGFIVNSAATGEALLRRARGPYNGPVAVAPIGFDSTHDHRDQPLLPAAGTRPYFVALGTIEPRKNHLLLLHIWRRLAEMMPGDTAPRLVLVGRRGWENENIVDLLDRCPGVRRLVVEHNALGDRQLTGLLAGAQALLMPSFAEGFGMPVIEALALGVPVIAADLPVYRECAGDLPRYLDPLDGIGWLRAVMEYCASDAPDRLARIQRAQNWSPPTWTAVGALHSREHLPIAGGVKSVPFAIAGYTLFIMFRSMVSRAETLLEANRPLLNHRRVTIFDMLLARALLEAASTTLVLSLLLFGSWLLDLFDAPADLLLMAGAVGLLAWFSFALSMIVTTLAHESPAAGRLIHPLLYLSMPLSGAFFTVLWLPESLRGVVGWIPTVPMFEMLRLGMFAGYSDDYAGALYPLAWCGVLTLLGLAGLRVLRPRVQLA